MKKIKSISIIATLVILFIDVCGSLGWLGLYHFDLDFIRGVFWYFIASILVVVCMRYKLYFSSTILLIYQLFISVCNFLAGPAIVFFDGSTIEEFAVDLFDVDYGTAFLLVQPFVFAVIAIILYIVFELIKKKTDKPKQA
jgi:hypothetical protein